MLVSRLKYYEEVFMSRKNRYIYTIYTIYNIYKYIYSSIVVLSTGHKDIFIKDEEDNEGIKVIDDSLQDSGSLSSFQGSDPEIFKNTVLLYLVPIIKIDMEMA